MTQNRRAGLPWLLFCLGAMGGSLAAAFRTVAAADVLAPWGVLAWLDLPLLAGALAALGLGLGFLLRLAGMKRSLQGRKITIVMLVVLVLCGTLHTWLLRSHDPVLGWNPAERVTGGTRLPDVAIVIYDAVRADVFYEDGEVPAWAPNLVDLAETGVVFSNAAAPAPWTLPAHASLFTGMTPLDHEAVDEARLLQEDRVTLAEAMRERGYRTVSLAANPWLSVERGFAQGFDSHVEIWRLRDVTFPLLFRVTGRLEARHLIRTEDPRFDKGARIAAMLTRRFLRSTPSDQPVFLFVNLVDAHPPYDPPWPYDQLDPPPPAGILPEKVSQDWVAIITGEAEMDESRWRVLRQLNQGEVAYLDEYLGELMDTMRGSGRFDGSLLAVTSDHGAALGENRWLGSGFDLSEPMLRIPLVVRFPDGRDGGTRRDDPVWLHDLYPTALAAADGTDPGLGEPAGDRMMGIPLAQRRNGAGVASYSKPLDLITQLATRVPEFDSSFLDRRMIATRGPDWKYVWSSDGKNELYDLQADGAESSNLVAERSEVRDDAHERLLILLGTTPEERWEALLRHAAIFARPEMDQETRRMLRSLGYLGGDD